MKTERKENQKESKLSLSLICHILSDRFHLLLSRHC
jgi:hypothetical protein